MAEPERKGEIGLGRVDGRCCAGRLWSWGVGGALLLAVLYVAVLLMVTDSRELDAFDNVAGLGLSLLASVALFSCAWHARRIPGQAAGAWVLLGLGYTAYAMGEALTALGGGYGLGALSYVMDLFYFAYYPLFFLGVLGLPKAPLTGSERLKVTGDITVVVLAAGIFLWTLAVGPALAQGGKDPLMTVNAVAFPLGDLALLWAVLSLMIGRQDRSAAGVYRLLAASALLLILTDITLSLRILDLVAWSGKWLGFGWFLGHLLSALAALKWLGSPKLEARDRDTPGPKARPSGGSFYLAYACLAAVLVVLMAGQPEAFSLVTTSAIVALLLLVLLRQIAGVKENAKLYTNLCRAHDSLEGRVRERTAELAKANEDLLVEVGERKKAEGRLQRQLKELVVLSAVAGMAGEAPDEDTLLSRVTEIIRDQLYPDNCGVLLLDQEAGVLRHAGSYHRHSDEVRVDDVPADRGVVGRVATTGKPLLVPNVTEDPDYIPMDPTMRSEMAVPLKAGNRILGVLDAESGTPNAFSEEDERILTLLASQVAAALERIRGAVAMRESEERFRCLSDAAFEGIGISEGERLIDVNTRLGEILGYESQEMVGRDIKEFVAPRPEPRIPDSPRRRRGDVREHRAIRKDGTEIVVETRGRDMPYHGRTVTVTAVRDITDWRRAEDRILLQVRRLAALRDIDAAINSRLDLKVTMQMFLEQVAAQLGVEAAAVLLLNEAGGGWETISSVGLPAHVLPVVRPLQDSWASRASQERKVMAVSDAPSTGQDRRDDLPLPPQVAACGFRSYFVAPLVVKEQAVGVLEVFARSPLQADREWMSFLETLAGQAAMAIDNRRLFESIRRSNSDLGEAYDTTLEGWSRALELRDRETQGHTLRVAEITMMLARAAGITEDDLLHVRRGALLHDIGKMGIPDGILLKPGPLDEEEWAVMRKHTTYAHELLSPVQFLKPALDIPYCHHERWDGTGYPRGLKGEAIPLSARVFAVVDSWDALSHDRPYRPAWSSAQVRDYLREKSGSHFEPRLVDLFLAMDE